MRAGIAFVSRGVADVFRNLGWDATLVVAAFTVAVAAGLIFTLWPGLDIAAAASFYGAKGRFVGNGHFAVESLRQLFVSVFVATSLMAIVGAIVTRTGAQTWLGIGFKGWLFLAVSLAMGPGVVTNVALKDHSGRARPSQIEAFGGTRHFTPVLQPANQCQHNCSFVSGEASSMFMVFFAAAFLYRRHARQLIAAGVATGAIAGIVRMAQGAHFLSDVVFAGVAMALTVAAINAAFRAVTEVREPQPSPAS